MLNLKPATLALLLILPCITWQGIAIKELDEQLWELALGTGPVTSIGIETYQAGIGSNTNEEEARQFLARYNREYGRLLNLATVAAWGYETNISDVNSAASQAAGLKLSQYNAEAIAEANQFDLTNFDEDIIRQLSKVGSLSLSSEETEELSGIIAKMGDIYGSSCVTLPEGGECLQLEPGLTKIMAESEDPKLRLWVWGEWRRIVGQKIRPLYLRYVALKNKLARMNGFSDLGDQWRGRYETTDFEGQMMALYDQMEPLYKELHAYIRRKLHDKYGGDVVDIRGPMPAHLLSDMWGRFWNNLYQFVEPFSGKPAIDPTEAMKKQNYTVRKMFQTGDDFYAAMGLFRVPDSFWKRSMLEKPEDREVICHATAWDFYDGEDFRIRMCTQEFSFQDLNTIHHELGHIQYQQQYKTLPQVYRDGANDGFHEAIGELMAMAGATPSHLFSIGLLDNLVQDEELDLNFLMSQALITISTLPYHLVNDIWRWRAFRGDYQEGSWNAEYWALKEQILGVAAPMERSQEDLDPPTIFHINQDFDMIRYFTRTILQFQFAAKLCDISGHTGPLHRCDFSGSKEAGSALAKMLSLGSSKPWQDALEELTGEREMSAEPILRFFDPLYQWLKKTNRENGDTVGWEEKGQLFKNIG